MLKVTPVNALSTNYVWLIHGENRRRVAIVDPGEAAPVETAVRDLGLEPEAVLVTHHHPDHVGGVEALVNRFEVPVYGPAGESIPCRTHGVGQNDRVELKGMGLTFLVHDIPGHTAGHIAFQGNGALFSGDTLFSGGCGRLFEGTAEQMLDSLDRLAALGDSTRLYCGHEYTEKNLAFCAEVEPGNPAIHAAAERARNERAKGHPTLPSTLGGEKTFNVFLRSREKSVQQSAARRAGGDLSDPVAVFRTLREWKDSF